MMPTATTIQTIVVPIELSRHRRTVSWAPTYVSVSWARRYAVRRALPRACRLSTSASSTRRSLAIVPRRASSAGVRGISPTNAAQRRPRLAEATGEQPDDELDDGEQGQLERAHRQARASRSAWRRCACGGGHGAGRGAGRAGGRRAPRGGGRGPAGRRRPGHRSGGPASTGRRRRRGTGIAGSKPPSARNRSARASRHADGRTKTSRTASCCSWSYSPGSVIGSTSPKRSRPSPTCWSTPGSSQETSFGPTKPALERYSSSTSRRMASGSRATSSWQKQKNPPSPSTRREHLVGGRAEAGVGAEVADEGVGKARRDLASMRHRLAGGGRRPADRPAGTACSGWGSPGRRASRASPRTSSPGAWTTTTATTGGASGASVSTVMRGYRRHLLGSPSHICHIVQCLQRS